MVVFEDKIPRAELVRALLEVSSSDSSSEASSFGESAMMGAGIPMYH